MAEKKKIEKSDDGKTKVLIVDDHSVVVEGIKSTLIRREEFEVVGIASDGLAAVKQVKSLKPDIVIMDISMPNLNGVEAAYDIKEVDKNIRIVIFSMYSDKEYILSLFRAGISGYVLKEDTIEDLILALRSVKGGGTYYSKSVQKAIKEHMDNLEMGNRETAQGIEDGVINLSAREKEVFPLLADGLNVREISKRLSISPKTVESHKYNIMEKLNVKSIADLTKIALRKNLIKL
jgi:DNA-binding NarL/FixJ family response regulator